MSNIPDFVLQIQEAEGNLKGLWQIVQSDWRGATADSFKEWIIEPYCDNFHQYITGEGIKGLGVDQLVQHMDKHMQDMSRLSGVSEDVAFSFAAGQQYNGKLNNWFGEAIDVEAAPSVMRRGGVVHDVNRDRDYWNDDPFSFGYDGAKPGELQDEDILKIMNQKR